MAVTYTAEGTVATAPSGNVTPSLPSGWAAGDVHICNVVSLDNVTSTMPSGWNALDPGTNNSTSMRTTSWYRLAQTGDTNPTVTHTAGSYIAAVITGYRGADQTTPVEVIGSVYVTTPASTIVTTYGITILTDQSMMVMLCGQEAKVTDAAWSHSMTERYDDPYINNYPTLASADVLRSTGATGNATCTASASTLSNGLLIAIKPLLTLSPTHFFALPDRKRYAFSSRVSAFQFPRRRSVDFAAGRVSAFQFPSRRKEFKIE